MNNVLKKIFYMGSINIKKIPFTIIFCILFAILFSIKDLFENSYISNRILFFCILSGLIIVNILLTEVSTNDKRKRIFGYIISIILAIILSLLGFSSLLFILKCNTMPCSASISDNTLYFTLCYILSMISVSIFVIYRKSKLNFYEYGNIVLNNLFKTIVVYIISSICLFFVSVLLDIVTNIDYKIIDMLFLLLFSLYVLPNIIISFIDTDIKINNLYKGIGVFCILPLTIICLLIIYFYIIKLLITKELPENLIFMLVLMVFIFGIISYFVSKNSDNKFNNIYCDIFSYIFILPVLLQSYSLFIRVSEYGLTPDRYITYMIIIFELVTLFLLKYKKGTKFQNILIAIITINIIICVGPFNLIRISNISQQNILNKNYNKTGEDYYKAVSAYEYLLKSEDGKKYITDEINKKLEKEVLDKKCITNYKSYYLTNKFTEIDISKYKSLKKVSISYRSKEENIKKVNVLNSSDKKIENVINVKEYVDYLITNNYLTKEEFNQNNIIEIDDNSIIYLDYLYFRTSKSDEYDIINLRGTGYLLEK